MGFKNEQLAAQRLNSAVLSYTTVCVKEECHITIVFEELQYNLNY
ncbi:hypothetical protein SAMN05421820_103719 [Pedobacter steynii]|uniref:Uncharacterized protein n=1 Tax=Pedobacter steynii TaxID=430522 RepID=A0A1G9SVL5_9SPHI|nr:hypothetical protein SAMN05421820_103719 [Pedobacter steynii]